MRTPFDWANLFLGYTQGPQVKAWVQDTSQLIAKHLAHEGGDTDKWIWTTVINDFTKTFQDHMSKDQARGDIHTIKMEQGDLDKYIADFKHWSGWGSTTSTKIWSANSFSMDFPWGFKDQ